MRTSFEHWRTLWHRFSVFDDGEDWHARLIAAWSEPQRGYHTLQHLDECLRLFDEVRAAGLISRPDLAEMALWFHDAVYEPTVSDNEERSADMALQAVCDDEAAHEIARLIMLTKSHTPGDGVDDAWIIDIDLAILGQPWERVLEYEGQIRQEYSWVPPEVYREKRVEILRGFLDRKQLYRTDWARQRLEQPARKNLRQLIGIVAASA
jgi:predicted metal-dependent HD superfamily phosphohydrolase